VGRLGGDVDAAGELAVDLAEQIRPDSKNVRGRGTKLGYTSDEWADRLFVDVPDAGAVPGDAHVLGQGGDVPPGKSARRVLLPTFVSMRL
jgi:hypothetical protein